MGHGPPPKARVGFNDPACRLTWNGQEARGKALLETKELIFRPAVKGGLRLVVPLADVQAVATRGDAPDVTFVGGQASFAIGAAEAGKWANKISTRARASTSWASSRATALG